MSPIPQSPCGTPELIPTESPSVPVPPVPPGFGWVGESFTRVDRGLARDLSQHDSDRLEPGLPLLVPVGKLVPAFFVVLFLPTSLP